MKILGDLWKKNVEVIRTGEVGFFPKFYLMGRNWEPYIRHMYELDDTVIGVTRILDRIGLSYTRQTYILTKADKEK